MYDFECIFGKFLEPFVFKLCFNFYTYCAFTCVCITHSVDLWTKQTILSNYYQQWAMQLKNELENFKESQSNESQDRNPFLKQ